MGRLTIGRRVFDCALAFGDNTDGRCNWCGVELTGRQVRWCSPDHRDIFAIHHYWTDARAAALKRDARTCQRCGRSEQPEDLWAWRRFLESIRPRPHLRDVPDWREWTTVTADWQAADDILRAEERARSMEVNHKVPILGRHAEAGCHHHLDGLETLCHRCHVEVTATQRAAGLLDR